MTILLLILAFAACLQACRLLLALSINALPVGIAIATAFWLNGHGHGLLTAILLALLVSMAFAGAAPWLCARCHAPAVRLPVTLIFVLPAGIAGYQASRALCQLLMPHGAAVDIASLSAGILIAILAAQRLGSGPAPARADHKD